MTTQFSRRALLTTTGIGAVSLLLAACTDKAETKAEAPAAPSKETTAAVTKTGGTCEARVAGEGCCGQGGRGDASMSPS